MFEFLRNRPAAATIFALLAAVAACDTPSDTVLEPDFGVVTGWEPSAFDVFSQNLFLGGDTGPLFDPAVIADPVALFQAVNGFWADVQDSDVQGRMAEIADEIGRQNPEVVGVQEALQFVTLDASFQFNGAGFIDLLAELQGAIDARGLPYETVVVQPTTSSALPLTIDFTTGQVTEYLGFTDRVAILKRSDVEVTDMASSVYIAAIPLAPGVDIKRGWARVTVDHEGTPHHFLTTHLETQGVRPVHDGQAFELLNAVVPGLDGITIVSGDLNSDAAAQEGDASWTPTYGNFIAAGFADLWELAPHSRRDHGFTCCQDPNLRNESSELDERIDFVLVRSSDGPIPGPGLMRGHFRADVVGDRARDRTMSGLWPADHAGLVGSIRAEGSND
jgi:endonuclease/exonuclease/phosphatase family metal-dependent hydrolase